MGSQRRRHVHSLLSAAPTRPAPPRPAPCHSILLIFSQSTPRCTSPATATGGTTVTLQPPPAPEQLPWRVRPRTASRHRPGCVEWYKVRCKEASTAGGLRASVPRLQISRRKQSFVKCGTLLVMPGNEYGAPNACMALPSVRHSIICRAWQSMSLCRSLFTFHSTALHYDRRWNALESRYSRSTKSFVVLVFVFVLEFVLELVRMLELILVLVQSCFR